ncbi:hypothetical protein AAV35_14220 [Salimicrobium jeotgali]|uniref:MurNAc-LAA domain-containing protein n=1 Tax=Salimicrobium jeotgali TaxID=1230341 RepID=K2FHA6_9BACI|nr:N-acetylmuramoyl-L-alanine amidase [Salimicrobium jeotgali]APC65612.1 hypothetical protein AAV35_14220 [Salimicrobium jeotgali]EKE30506.1 hypothetical protein MJ3_13734 [Salimicrobium jeotgali]MBM7696655.1 peptidoglycan hydrolase-like protein with peptidoglycan-binding domain [Salimicrobium jeotgali]
MSKTLVVFAGHYEDLFDEEGSKGIYTDTEADGQYEEYDSNIVIARHTVEELSDVDGLRVLFPQKNGADYRSLRARVDYCNRNGADMVLFIHSNASSARSAHGACAFYYYTSGEGKRMANIYRDEMQDAGYPLWSNGTYGCNPDDGWSNFFVVRKTAMPVLLTENFFFTNPKELREYLQDGKDLKKIGHIHARVACRSLGLSTNKLGDGAYSSSADPEITGVYGEGDRGPGVKRRQNLLLKLDYDMDGYGADGSFGPATVEAVKAFQKKHGLAVDGMVGPKTEAKMKEVLKAKNDSSDDSEEVKQLKTFNDNYRLESKVNDLRFYGNPSWSDEDKYGTVDAGIGFPKVERLVKVGRGRQYEVVNSNGDHFYITAAEKFVTLKETDTTPSYVGRRVESHYNGRVRFYNAPSWEDEHHVGSLTKGQGFPEIVEKVNVGGGKQYKAKNSNGEVYYVTSNENYVQVV